MANIFCVSYDLKGDPEDYSDLYDALTTCRHWWHFLESTWLVDIESSAQDLWDRLKPHLQRNDRMLIIGVTSDFHGSLPKAAWDWIQRIIESEVPHQ